MDAVTRPQSPPRQNTGFYLPDLNLTGERQPRPLLPLSGHQLMEMWPAQAPSIPHLPGSTYFYAQEQAFFSHSNSYFRIDAGNPQATGGPLRQENHNTQADSRWLPTTLHHPPPPQQPSLSSRDVPPPFQCQPLADFREFSPPPPPPRRSSRLQTTLINPLLATTGASNSRHVGSYRAAAYNPHPYTRPEITQDPSTTADEDSWRYPIPISERRRAGKAPRRRYN